MKIFKITTPATLAFLFLTFWGYILTAQTSQTTNPIPANILNIAGKSCVKCHTVPGNMMALSHLNLSKWDTYSAEKQAAKAKAMCDMISKDKMPPKKFKAQNPGFLITKDEIKIICDWSASIQVAKK